MRKVLLITLTLVLAVGFAAFCDADDDALGDGGLRLEQLQNNDGGWDWPLDDGNPSNTSPVNTIGPIAMGLSREYWNNGGVSFQGALADTGALLLTKLNNFSPSDGYLATMLDSIFGGSTYRDHVQANFYGPLAAGTYNKSGSGTLYSTASYVQLIRNARAGLGNLGEWDLGMGLVGAAACGAATADWVDGVKAELNEHNSNGWYDVIGLAGALYGLALVEEEFDPTSGDLASASSLADLGGILAGYQIGQGGFAWNSNYVIPNDGNETVQETAYAILALNQLGRIEYLDMIQGAADWLVSFQLGTGGWENYSGSGENNEITGEALWGIHAVYVEDLYVASLGHDQAFGYGAIPFATVSQATAQMEGLGGEVHVAPGIYQEQVVVGGDLILTGTPGAIILAPTTPGKFKISESTATWEPVVFLYGGTDDGSGNISGAEISLIDIRGLVVDGNDRTPTDRSAGILLRNVAGTVADNTVQNMNIDGKQTFGIIVYGDSDVVIDGNTVTGFSRGGIGVMSGFAVISNNTVLGPGLGVPVTWAPNGIQIGYGAQGTISGNEVTGCGWPGTDWAGTAIMVVDTSNVIVENNYVHDNETGIGVTDFPEAAYGAAWAGNVSNIIVQGNTLDQNEWSLDIVNEADNVSVLYNVISNSVYDGIDVYSYDLYWPGLGIPYPTNVVIHYNSITGSGGDGLWVMDGIGAPVDATLNWWGDNDGPSGEGTGAGDSVSTNVIFSPWLGIDPDGDPGTVGVQLISPMLFIVDDVGPAPALGYLGAAIDAANTLPGIDSIEVRHGTYDASEPITDGVNIY
ncbi:right-handed parallel beta-helix repeat-containing protein, partial [Candidatus Bipolaricaulota bacterium]|nr:right-handed parallel beta-helix repeat-containing protein [Candidatus Bipolaricaulota bacterium]